MKENTFIQNLVRFNKWKLFYYISKKGVNGIKKDKIINATMWNYLVFIK
jgi:hypothetical protein